LIALTTLFFYATYGGLLTHEAAVTRCGVSAETSRPRVDRGNVSAETSNRTPPAGYSRPTNTALACARRSNTRCFSAALFQSG
jgi:hypothetical protein